MHQSEYLDSIFKQYDADYVAKAALLHWMVENDCPFPSAEDMSRCIEWVSEQIAKDILKDILI